MLVKFFATYRQIAGCESFDTPAPSNVLELLTQCSQRWPEFETLLLNESKDDLGPDAIVMVSGRHIQHLDGVQTKLSEDVHVTLTPLVAGG